MNRDRFPGVVHADENGRVLADNAAGAQLPDLAIERIHRFLRLENAPKGSGFERAEATLDLVAEAKQAFADLIAQPAERVGIAPNATTAAMAFSRLLAGEVRAGERIVVTDADHSANVEPWTWLERFGATIERIGVDATGNLDEVALVAALERGPFLVALPWCSNATGRRYDVARLGRAAKAAGALVVVDGVQALPHIVVDIDDSFDLVTFSAYKMYAPHIGFWYMSDGAHDRFLRPDHERVAGGNARVWTMETGTQSHEALAGWLGTITYLAEVGTTPRAAIDILRAYEHDLTAYVLQRFSERSAHLTLYGEGPAAERLPVFAFNVAGVTSDALAGAFADATIDARVGDFYCHGLMRTLAPDRGGRAVRLSLAHYSSRGDVDRCFAVVDTAIAKAPIAR